MNVSLLAVVVDNTLLCTRDRGLRLVARELGVTLALS